MKPSQRRAAPSRLANSRLLNELSTALTHLIEDGQWDAAYLTLDHGLNAGPNTAIQRQWLALLRQIPETQRAQYPQAAWLTVRLLCNTRAPAELLAFLEVARPSLSQSDLAPLLAFQAFSLTQTGQYAAALSILEELLPDLPHFGVPELALGIAWRAYAEARCLTHQDGWQAAFAQARTYLQGRPLGLCWSEEGSLLERSGQDAAARDAWRQALMLLEYDPLYMAWLRNSLGNSCLRFALPEAEDHFLEMEKAARQPEAAEFRAWAACGLGAARRTRGEWERAISSFEQALKVATEPDDQQQAWRGLGHTRRLMGKPERALEDLMRAAVCTPADRESGTSWVYADIAACYVQMGDIERSARALEQTGKVWQASSERAAIVQAELARRAGDEAAALDWLAQVRMQAIWAREECRQFPDLFELLPAPQRPVPLAYAAQMRVEVSALGSLQVQVNGRRVPLRATGRPAELLVLLLEHGNRAASEVVTGTLYPATLRRKANQAVWALVRELQHTLGWQDSVRLEGGAYLLDPQAQWWYDVREAQARGQPTPAFLSGIYQPWVLERAEELAQ
ncbi:tetratricopeptide repeat protein (plasmid) [Deinococcus sp. KNUC1210]|uniref:tetratricopeptide repeat protein n=1 Tax=Deinococcus sp. KNUC1210 TaxID=2917691 RepID=UPI001EF01177|nr:tetratricopeptide repeat protein [Deinococcus sp. KNUC1210]ULH14105.1 tetratricopeptide repeat protein [Deinococcus sp. KNUC1210]